jgi:hypothetical protein
VSAVLALAPALPLHTAGKYVAGAYIVFLAIVLIYVAIMATRLARTERELVQLRRDVEAQKRAQREHDLQEEAGRQPGRLGETRGRAVSSERGTANPARELL